MIVISYIAILHEKTAGLLSAVFFCTIELSVSYRINRSLGSNTLYRYEACKHRNYNTDYKYQRHLSYSESEHADEYSVASEYHIDNHCCHADAHRREHEINHCNDKTLREENPEHVVAS